MKTKTLTTQNMDEFSISREDFLLWAPALATKLPHWAIYAETFDQHNPWHRLGKHTKIVILPDDDSKRTCTFGSVKDFIYELDRGKHYEAYPLQRYIKTVLNPPAPVIEVDL